MNEKKNVKKNKSLDFIFILFCRSFIAAYNLEGELTVQAEMNDLTKLFSLILFFFLQNSYSGFRKSFSIDVRNKLPL